MAIQQEAGGSQNITSDDAYATLQASPIWQLALQVQTKQLSVVKAYRRAARVWRPDDPTLYRYIVCIRALAQRDLDLAVALAELIELFARHSPDPHIQGDSSNTLGLLYSKRGMLEPTRGSLELARGAYAAALRAYEPLPDTRWVVAEIRLELGLIQEHQGLAAQAVAMYRAVVEFLEQHPCEKLEIVARHRLGHALLIQGRADLALVEIERALKLSQRLGADRTKQRALGNRGRVYQVLGRFAEAESDQREALASSRQLGEHADIGHHLNHLAMILIARRKLDEAEPHIQEALDIARQLQDHESTQQCLGNLGLLYQARADRDAGRRREWLDLALDCYQKAVAIARDRNDWRHLGDHLLNEGNIYREIEQRSEAHACYQQALALAKAYHADDTEWRIRYASGTLCMLQEQYAQAFEQYKRAIAIVERQRGQLESIESRSRFWQEKAPLYKQMALCCLRRGDLWQALVYTEQAKARYLADLHEQRAGPRKGMGAGWRGKARALFRRSGAPRDDTRAIIEQAIAGLPPRSAIVVFNIIDEGAAIFIATHERDLQIDATPDANWRTSPDGRLHACLLTTLNRKALQDMLVQIGQNDSISGYLGDYHTNRERWYASTLRQACEDLSASLLRVVDRALRPFGVERLILMPNLGLSLLPLHACPIDGADGPICLLHRYEISYAPSFELLQYAQARVQEPGRAGRRLLAVATPNENLYWAGVEAAALKELFTDLGTAHVLDHTTRPQATPKAVEQLAPEYTYIHFACHGVFNLAEPLQSALKLIGCDLTLQDMLSSDLSDSTAGLSLPHTRLVVLGACEIGMVDFADLADEAMGLPSGFMLAGAPAVLATLWEVDDLATFMLMQRFYLYHLHGDPDHPQVGPLGPAAALQRAQIWLRDELTAAQVIERIDQQLSHLSQTNFLVSLQLKSQRQKMLAFVEQQQARPFADLRYWAAFTITGV